VLHAQAWREIVLGQRVFGQRVFGRASGWACCCQAAAGPMRSEAPSTPTWLRQGRARGL
jgi:hypothetical protein